MNGRAGRRCTRAAGAAWLAALALTGCPPPEGVREDAIRAEAALTATPTGEEAVDTAWQLPLDGAALPTESNLLPNAGRGYRGGIHEGVDFFRKADGSPIPCRSPVVNARAGWIVRADHTWAPMNSREFEVLTAALHERRDEDQLDRLRGRQVWVRCEDGTVLRYCHLASVDPDARVGLRAERGTRLGETGNTGTRDGAKGTGLNCHLHFEIRTPDGGYLGQDTSTRAAREAYAERFNLP